MPIPNLSIRCERRRSGTHAPFRAPMAQTATDIRRTPGGSGMSAGVRLQGQDKSVDGDPHLLRRAISVLGKARNGAPLASRSGPEIEKNANLPWRASTQQASSAHSQHVKQTGRI